MSNPIELTKAKQILQEYQTHLDDLTVEADGIQWMLYNGINPLRSHYYRNVLMELDAAIEHTTNLLANAEEEVKRLEKNKYH